MKKLKSLKYLLIVIITFVFLELVTQNQARFACKMKTIWESLK